MTFIRSLWLFSAIVACWTDLPVRGAEPVRIIFDTDIGNDVDDVLALGVLHALQTRGECELLAVTITKNNPLAASFVDAVNTFYGRGAIPIGVCRPSGKTPDAGKFLPLANAKDGEQDRYPHDAKNGEGIEPAVSLLRRLLAHAAIRSVVVVQVGFSTNLADLLQSPGDSVSPLSGRELVKEKVRLVSVMAGAFEKIPDGKGNWNDHREYNVEQDIPSAKILAEQCDAPMVWSGFEIGLALPYPHVSIERDYGYVPHHPLAEAYYAYSPPPHDRPTWDLTSVLYAVRPDRGYFELSPEGRVTVADDSRTTFTPGMGGKHRFLKLTSDGKPRTLEALMLLSSEPRKS